MTSFHPALADIQALEEALHRPGTRRSRTAIEALLAEDFVEFGASGAVYDRDDIIDLLVHGGGETREVSSTDFALKPISGDAVLLTYESHEMRNDGTERTALRSSIWRRQDGRWQMLFHQGTLKSG